MKTSRLITLMSVATMTSALLLPAVASAHGRSDRWHQSHEERWTPPSKHATRDHHRHDKWSKRYGKHAKGRAKIYVDGPRRPPRLVHREPPVRLHLGNGLTIIYR